MYFLKWQLQQKCGLEDNYDTTIYENVDHMNESFKIVRHLYVYNYQYLWIRFSF